MSKSPKSFGSVPFNLIFLGFAASLVGVSPGIKGCPSNPVPTGQIPLGQLLADLFAPRLETFFIDFGTALTAPQRLRKKFPTLLRSSGDN